MSVMLDTNILIYHLTQNHPVHSPASTALIRDIELGRIEVYYPSTAVLESIYVLRNQFGGNRTSIAEVLSGFLAFPNVKCEYKAALISSLDFWQSNSGLDFADCYHLALTKELGMSQIYSFDKKMNRFPGVERIEPDTE